MTKLIMGIGIPGSGKSTVLKSFAEKNHYAYISPDAIREELTGNAMDQTKNREVWVEAKKRMIEKFGSGETVVFDASFTKPGERKEFVTLAREHGAEKITGILMDTDLNIAKERNRNRERVVPEYALERMHKSLHEALPETEEGFDSIFTLDEEQKLTDAEIAKEGIITHREFGEIR